MGYLHNIDKLENLYDDMEDMMDGLDGLKILYGGRDIEGEVLPEYTPPKDPVFKDIIFSLDGKKYKIKVEEIQ